MVNEQRRKDQSCRTRVLDLDSSRTRVRFLADLELDLESGGKDLDLYLDLHGEDFDLDLDSGGKDLDLDLYLHGEDFDLDLDSGGKDLDLDLDLNFEDLTTSLVKTLL